MKSESISAQELKTRLDAGSVVVVDVRTITEFEEGHIWSSLNHPIDGLPKSLLEISKTSFIVTVCNLGGGRSERAVGILREAGWPESRWLEGGYLGWMKAGFPDYEPGFASS
jgi:hydroxyacylglutathione hydrolase